jgi:hypothetical protein
MMWKRWGTPPAASGSYTSGFEEEFETSVIRRQRTGKPEISLFFKGVDTEPLRDSGTELAKVVAFKDRLIAERIVLFDQFDEASEFESELRAWVTTYVQNLQAEEAGRSAKGQSAPAQSRGPQTIVDTKLLPTAPRPDEGTTFLREFIGKTERDYGAEIQPVEVARFRLLASIVTKQGNDERPLGVHDTNLIYAHRFTLSLSHRELVGLVDAGLESYASEVTPLWHWNAAIGGFSSRLLASRSLSGTPAQQAGPLAAMQLISERLPNPPKTPRRGFERADYVGLWLGSKASSQLKVAALGYLGVQQYFRMG